MNGICLMLYGNGNSGDYGILKNGFANGSSASVRWRTSSARRPPQFQLEDGQGLVRGQGLENRTRRWCRWRTLSASCSTESVSSTRGAWSWSPTCSGSSTAASAMPSSPASSPRRSSQLLMFLTPTSSRASVWRRSWTPSLTSARACWRISAPSSRGVWGHSGGCTEGVWAAGGYGIGS